MIRIIDWTDPLALTTYPFSGRDELTRAMIGWAVDSRRVPNLPTKTYLPEPKTVIFNPPATIVYWEDGEKTIVKCMEGDEFSPEVGLAMCLAKYIFGKRYKKWFRDALEKGRWQGEKATKRIEDEKSCESVEQTERRIEEKAREYGDDVHRAVRKALEEALNKNMGVEEQ